MVEFSWPPSAAAMRVLDGLKAKAPDLAARVDDYAVLAEFRKRFPPEDLRSIGLESYCVGGGNKESFSNWLENKLSKLGLYGVGSSKGHLVYKQKDGSYYILKQYVGLPLEEAFAAVKETHARVVELGSAEWPEKIESMALDWSGHAVDLIDPKRFPSRVLKLLHSYFPERYFPINSVAQIEQYLEGLGLPRDSMPTGFIQKNLLLRSFFDRHVAPLGWDAIGFMRQLYASELAPLSLEIRKKEIFEGASRLFTLYYGEEGFDSALYDEDERSYKLKLRDAWNPISDALRVARTSDELAAAGKSVAKFLQPSKDQNILNWRYTGSAKGLDDAAAAMLAEATQNLLFGSAESPDVEAFNEVFFGVGGMADSIGPENRAASRSVPTFLLFFEDPSSEIFIRSDSFGPFATTVTGRNPLREGPLTNRDYAEYREFAHVVFEALTERGLHPLDMIDVQGFMWRTMLWSSAWFVGHNFGGVRNQLDLFRERGVWAWSRGEEMTDELRAWIEAHTDLSGLDSPECPVAGMKKETRKQFEAYRSLIAKGGLIFAKTTTYDQKAGTSILAIQGLARVEKDSTVLVEGSTVVTKAQWLGATTYRILDAPFGKVAATIQELDMTTTLSLLGKAERMNTMPEPDTLPAPFPVARSVSMNRPAPQNLILYGPPGTGKTHRLRTDFMA
ncbi:MAG: hypothetical protein WCL50_12715, partial [Spirochaetota bacterium]